METLPSEPSEAGDATPTPSPLNSIITFSVIAIVLIGTLLAFVYVPQVLRAKEIESYKYNNFAFQQQEGNVWSTQWASGTKVYPLLFYYHPKDLEDIVLESNIRQKFFDLRSKNGSLYIAVDPDAPENRAVIAGVEIGKITGEKNGIFGVRTHSALLKVPSNTAVNTQIPIMDCSNANETTMVLAIVVTDKNLVSSAGNCLRVEAKTYNDTIRVADRLMYNLLGIMN